MWKGLKTRPPPGEFHIWSLTSIGIWNIICHTFLVQIQIKETPWHNHPEFTSLTSFHSYKGSCYKNVYVGIDCMIDLNQNTVLQILGPSG